MNAFIGVPQKGRNAGIALRELGIERADYILDVLNGAGKLYAKKGQNREFIEQAVDRLDCVELEDTDRAYPRPVFDELQEPSRTIKSFEDPIQGSDRFFMGLDRFAETYGPEIDGSLQESVERYASQAGFRLEETYGDEVQWAAMNTDLGVEPEEVLVPEEFESVASKAAGRYWEDPDVSYFSSYGSDEEEVLAETPESVAGVYMVVSGGTAEEQGLEYDPVEGFSSRLGEFSKTGLKTRSEASDVGESK